MECSHRDPEPPHASESSTVLDSGFEALNSIFQELDSSLCRWNLDSGFQSLVGFRILSAVFRIPQANFSRILEHGATFALPQWH